MKYLRILLSGAIAGLLCASTFGTMYLVQQNKVQHEQICQLSADNFLMQMQTGKQYTMYMDYKTFESCAGYLDELEKARKSK
ncbi:hypothetical protein COOFOMLJ_01593 [Aeromonas veronii]